TKTDGEGTSTYAYDGNGNMTSASYPASQWYQNGLVEEFNYDGENRPAQKSTPDNTVIYIYDDAGRLSQANNGMSYLDCARDANGNITSKRLSFWQGDQEKEFTYAYSPAGRMQSASDEHGTTAYSYDEAGRLDSKAYPNGVDTSYAYDSSGALSALQMDNPSGTLKSYSVARDSCARITGLTEDGSLLTTYSYDAASRLTGESNPFTGGAAYAYDECGNRTSKTTDSGTTTCTYDPADRLTEDSEGNTYTYNGRGDLIRKSDGTHALDIARDGKGRAESIMVMDGIMPVAADYFLYDAQDRVYMSMEYDPTNPQPTPLIHSYDMDTDREVALFDYELNIDSLFFSGADGLISATTPEGTSYMSYNPHSDLSMVTDQSATPLEQLHYDAWGNKAEQTDQPYAYLGKHQRPDYNDIGLIRMGARLYDPETGRFTSEDPLRGSETLPISQNAYAYANDDPVNYHDLNGMRAVIGEGNPQTACLQGQTPSSSVIILCGEAIDPMANIATQRRLTVAFNLKGPGGSDGASVGITLSNFGIVGQRVKIHWTSISFYKPHGVKQYYKRSSSLSYSINRSEMNQPSRIDEAGYWVAAYVAITMVYPSIASLAPDTPRVYGIAYSDGKYQYVMKSNQYGNIAAIYYESNKETQTASGSTVLGNEVPVADIYFLNY
ncbi:MAG: hypothetical protein KKF41_06800, partial [Actinobacteria bacterium]|nr:hypothetical protein [Actinomycetota bacterium]MBU1942569.1 hypothetical protein [Actinomycetota bacterium]MBU2687276.1 hypothetical protein [Actinomycetota bacterium]